MPMNGLVPATCYFTPQELRGIEDIAEKEEQPRSKMVQTAVRVFQSLYQEDPDRAIQLARKSRDRVVQR